MVILLLHNDRIPQYRVPVYGYISKWLGRNGIRLQVAAEGVEDRSPYPVDFDFLPMPLGVRSITNLLGRDEIDVVILFINPSRYYLFPTYFAAKALFHKKVIYWGQGIDLSRPASMKNRIYRIEHTLADSILLYADHLKRYIPRRFHHKVFIANNTLCITPDEAPDAGREETLAKFNIGTRRNIICIGRMQRRKRLSDLITAHRLMGRPDVGLILAGPDPDGVLDGLNEKNIFKIGALYGREKYNLLSAADIYCLPGAVGLSIVDALYCGLPFVTEEGDESAEIMYLKNGVNGFVVRRGDMCELASRLMLLVDDDGLRKRFSDEARRTAATTAHIDRMCEGFIASISYVSGRCKA
jgi:glycosyltransferase involved in cell wall biosynthesis